MSNPNVIPLVDQINKTQREIDEIYWEGKLDLGKAIALESHLQYLKDQEAGGELWYPLF